MISVTEKAIQRIKEISDEEGIGHYNIRAKVLGGGCAGLTHDLYFEDCIKNDDERYPIADICVIVDPLSLLYLDGVEIDYVVGNMGAGFKFINPNVKSTCGCGNSFSA